MTGTPDNDRKLPKPYLIEADGEGGYRLTLRSSHYNSQNYPVVTKTVVDETFRTTGAARAFAKSEFSAIDGEFVLPRRATK